jgi:hypothetical protein
MWLPLIHGLEQLAETPEPGMPFTTRRDPVLALGPPPIDLGSPADAAAGPDPVG